MSNVQITQQQENNTSIPEKWTSEIISGIEGIVLGCIVIGCLIVIFNYFNIFNLSSVSTTFTFLPHQNSTESNTQIVTTPAQTEINTTSSLMLIPGRIINTYLISSFGKAENNGQIFCSTYPLGRDSQPNAFHQYIWGICQEYMSKNNILIKGSLVSKPLILSVQNIEGHYAIASYTVIDETTYSQFPTEILQNKFISDSQTHTLILQQLESDINKQARKYFNL